MCWTTNLPLNIMKPPSCARTQTCTRTMFARRTKQSSSGRRQFSSTSRSQRRHIDHYATLCVPRTATKAQIKTSYYQLSKKHHPDVTKDDASQTKFHAVSEAYAILGDDRKRREYDRSIGSPFHAPRAPGQHPQATTTRPSQQPGFKHFWPTHPQNRGRDSAGYPGADYHDRARPGAQRHPSGSRTSNVGSGSRTDPFSSPFVQRATGHRRSGDTQPNYHYQQGGFQGASSAPWTTAGGGGRQRSADGRPTRDEAAAESGVLRALGASGLVGVIMLIAAIACNSKRTS